MGTSSAANHRSAFKKAVGTPLTKIAGQLQELLGARLAAYVSGLADPKAIVEIAFGSRSPQPDTVLKIRNAHQVVVTLQEADLDGAGLQAWFLGMNPDLGDDAPADVIIEQPKKVLEAARAFVHS